MQYVRYILSGVASLLAVLAWLSIRSLGVPLNPYDIFPLLGLVAFSLMWAQIISGAVGRLSGVKARRFKRLDAVISGLILSLIILHPLTVWVALFIDGAGLPPDSYISTYGTSAAAVGALLLGSISLVIFLSYELHRWFSDTPWWKYVLGLQSLALGFIFFHALVLGQEAGHSWFTGLWVFYGVTLAAALVYTYIQNKRKGSA